MQRKELVAVLFFAPDAIVIRYFIVNPSAIFFNIHFYYFHYTILYNISKKLLYKYKNFVASKKENEFCSQKCKNQFSVYKSREKKKGD